MTLQEYANTNNNKMIVDGIARAVRCLDKFDVVDDCMVNNTFIIRLADKRSKSSSARIVIPIEME